MLSEGVVLTIEPMISAGSYAMQCAAGWTRCRRDVRQAALCERTLQSRTAGRLSWPRR